MPDADPKLPRDVVLLHSPTEDGEGARVLRLKEETLSVAEVRPLVEGQPVNDREVVRLRPREGAPRVYDVETLYEPPRRAVGPAKVSTRQFREGWEAIFGAERGDEREPN